MLTRSFSPAVLAFLVATPMVAAMGGGFGWVWAVLGISFLIAVHEWGHYMACVLTKTRTETFSIGFGPRLFGWERDREGKRRFTVGARQLDPEDHAMDFRIAAVPLGGFVKMAGGEIIGESTSEDPNEFVNKSASARIFIISAGVIMNVITAFVLYTLAFQFGKEVEPPYIGQVVNGGPAWRAGIEPGDKVERVNGAEVYSFLDLRLEVVFSGYEERSTMEITRDGESVEVAVLPDYNEERGIPQIEAKPATRLTLGEGDESLTIDWGAKATVGGWTVHGGAQALATIQKLLALGTDEIVVEQADKTITLRLDPGTEDDRPDAHSPKVGIEQFRKFEVTAMRAPADASLRLGDVLVGVESGGQRYATDTGSRLQQAQLLFPVEALIVQREGAEQRLALTLTTRADVDRFFRSFGVKPAKEDAVRLRPIEAGHLFPHGGGIWRYPSSPALDAGIRPGDELKRVGDTKIQNFPDLIKVMAGSEAGTALDFTVVGPDGKERVVEINPVALTWAGRFQHAEQLREPVDLKGGGFTAAIGLGFTSTGREIKNVFRTIGALFTGKISFNKNIAGPITLIRASKQQAARGPASLLWFLAYISVMLAVLNILPIPVLDGGHLLFIILEKVKGSPLSEGVVVKAMYVGLFLLLTLMFFAFKNDIMRLWA